MSLEQPPWEMPQLEWKGLSGSQTLQFHPLPACMATLRHPWPSGAPVPGLSSCPPQLQFPENVSVTGSSHPRIFRSASSQSSLQFRVCVHVCILIFRKTFKLKKAKYVQYSNFEQWDISLQYLAYGEVLSLKFKQNEGCEGQKGKTTKQPTNEYQLFRLLVDE